MINNTLEPKDSIAKELSEKILLGREKD